MDYLKSEFLCSITKSTADGLTLDDEWRTVPWNCEMHGFSKLIICRSVHRIVDVITKYVMEIVICWPDSWSFLNMCDCIK